MPKYKVQNGEHIQHDGKDYFEGDIIICKEEHAKMLRVDPVEEKPKSIDVKVDEAIAVIGAMTNAKEIAAYTKEDDRQTVAKAVADRIAALKA